MKNFMQTAPGIYCGMIRIQALAQLQYLGWILACVNNLFYVVTDPLDAVLLMRQFGSIGECTAARILLMYGMALCSFGLSEVFLRGFDLFPTLVRQGDFDRTLLRPRGLLLQVAPMRFHWNRMTRMLAGALLIGLCLKAQGICPGFKDWIMLILALLGGVLCYGGIFLFFGALSFFTIASMDMVNLFTNGSYQVAKLPPRYLPEWVQSLFTCVMPMFVFAYYPASAVCGWGDAYLLGFLALPACAAFFALSTLAWRIGVRHYQSTGS